MLFNLARGFEINVRINNLIELLRVACLSNDFETMVLHVIHDLVVIGVGLSYLCDCIRKN